MSYSGLQVEQMTAAYITCALWASVDEQGEPLDAAGPELSDAAREELESDCTGFLALLDEQGVDYSTIQPEQMGHDLWLTRNHHGAGFWDRGLGELGQTLTTWAESLGGADLYIGDSGYVEV